MRLNTPVLVESPPILAHAIALAIGVCAFLVFFGPGFLIGESPFLTQPRGDVAAEMGGYFRMAQDSWRFPLFSLPTANLPEGGNQLFVGGVPILALLAKMVHSLTGTTINLFGFWYFLCCVLQAHSFYFLLSQMVGRRANLLAFAAVFSVLAYAFETRVGHVSLFGQFLNIYAVGLVIATTREDANPGRILKWLMALSVIAMFVFAYFAITNAAMFGAALLSLVWLQRISIPRAAVWLGSFLVVMIAFAWLGGYFWGAGKAAPVDPSSYSQLGLNVGSLVIPHQSAIFPYNPLFSNWWEGDFYLGAGIIALWAFVLIMAPKAIYRPIRRNPALAAFLLLFALFCISNHINFGDRTVLSYGLPRFFNPIIGFARAGGRLFWPVGYLLLAVPIAVIILRFPAHARRIVVAAVLFSAFDATGSLAFIRELARKEQPVPVNYEGLKSLVNEHKAVRVFPSFWCNPGLDESPKRVFHWQVEYASAVANAESNSLITARKIKNCDIEAETIPTFQGNALHIYLSRDAFDAALKTSTFKPEEVCRSFKLGDDQAAMCSTKWASSTKLPIAELVPYADNARSIAVGNLIKFGISGNATPFLGIGWWRDPEANFNWTEGKRSLVSLQLPQGSATEMTLDVELVPFLAPPKIASRNVTIYVNDKKVDYWRLTTGEWQTKSIKVPAEALGSKMTITFEQDDVSSPRDLGQSNDPRRLGIAVKSITPVAN